MALENWIDKIADLWSAIETHEAGTLRSYKLATSADFPESISAPCVMTYPTEMSLTYSIGGPLFEHWIGQSDFYLFDNVSKVNLPMLVPYFARIRNVAIASITLSSTVVNFSIGSDNTGRPTIQGPVSLQYGDNDNPHHGLVVNWFVKEDISNESGVSPSA